MSVDEKARANIESAVRQAAEIVAAYGKVLEQSGKLGYVYSPASILPCAKDKIRQALELLLLVPSDEAERNNLECADVLLDDFIPDEDYAVVHQQRGGMSQALELIQAGERDTKKVLEAFGSQDTEEGENKLRLIHDRVRRDNVATLEKHKSLRCEAEKIKPKS